MALLGLNFNLKKTIGIVLVLLVIAVGFGYFWGYDTNKNNSSSAVQKSQDPTTPDEKEVRRIADELKRKVEEQRRNEAQFSNENNSTKETTEGKVANLKRKLQSNSTNR